MQSVGAGMKRKTKPGSALPPQHLNKGRRRASGKEFLYDVVNNVMSGPAAMPAPVYHKPQKNRHTQNRGCTSRSGAAVSAGYATVRTKQAAWLGAGFDVDKLDYFIRDQRYTINSGVRRALIASGSSCGLTFAGTRCRPGART